METNTLIEAIRLILGWRFQSPDVVGFNANNNVKCGAGEYEWYFVPWVDKNRNGSPAIKYTGGGAGLHEAVQNAFGKVVNDLRDGYESGLG